ncbi:putative tetratricopeptide-like helical domain superfamily [Helianthus annuus]|nr:putative tetratricopeptide-like helical domain superfamily [Helianthus annuus]
MATFSTFSLREKLKRAREFFDEIQEESVMINTSTYTTLIDGYRKLKILLEAFKLLDEMP